MLALLGCGTSQAPQPRPRNVVLVSIDTLRADHLRPYGYADGRTPHIDALAARGVLFEDVTSVAPLTAPSHTTLLTGLYPPQHGVRSNGLYALDPARTTLAEVLAGRGLATGAVVGGFPLDRRFGLAQGFDSYDDLLPPAPPDAEAERPASAVADSAIHFLEEHAGAGPFFLFVHFYDPHADYHPPPEFAGLPPYDGEVAYVDRELGRILDALAARGVRAETAVIVVSDHGESLGEHGEQTHAVFVYQSTVHVPLIVDFPPLREAGAAARVTEPVSIVDVTPTILDMLGAPPMPGAAGTSLVPLWSGAESPDRPIYFESLLPQVEFGWAALTGVRRGSLKYIEAPRPELFDVTADPTEQHDLWNREPRGAALRSELVALAGRLWPGGAVDTRRVMDAEERAKLETLGYLGTGGASTDPTAVAADPKDRIGVLTRMVQGLGSFKDGRYAESEGHYRTALESDPDNAVLMKNLAKAVAAQDRLADADAILTRAVAAAAGPLRGDVLALKAELALRAGRLEDATTDARSALAIDPTATKAATTLAAALERGGRADEARAALGEAIARAPDRAAPRVAQAELDVRLGATAPALATLREAVRVEPDHARARYDLGVLLINGGQMAEGIGHLERARLLLPGEPEIAHKLAQAYLSQGRLEQSAAILEEAVRLHPEDVDGRYDLAVILSRSGAADRAVALLRTLAGERPAEGRIWNALGTALGRRGEFEEALSCFEKAVARTPDDADYRDNLETAKRALSGGPLAAEPAR